MKHKKKDWIDILFAHEHIQKIKLKEIVCIILISIIISLLLFLNNFLFNPSVVFITSLAFLTLGLNLSVYLIRKTGVATIFYLLTAILTITLPDLGITGGEKIIVFLIAGILFGGPFLILKLHLHSLPLDMIIGTIISTASIPLVTAFLLSGQLASSFPLALVNLIILAAAVGLFASIVAFLVWHHLEKTKLIIRLKTYLIV